MKTFDTIAQEVMQGKAISKEEALDLISYESEEEVLNLAHAANAIRKTFTSKQVDFCSLINAKSGCSFHTKKGALFG